jgi:hypothetical protein
VVGHANQSGLTHRLGNSNDSDAGKSQAFDDFVRVPDISREAGELIDGNGIEGGRRGKCCPKTFLKAPQESDVGSGDGPSPPRSV